MLTVRDCIYPVNFKEATKNYVETLRECALRETQEETGYGACDIELHEGWEETLHYVLPNGKEKASTYFLGRVSNMEREAILSNEHTAMEWCRLEKAVELVGFSDLQALVQQAARSIAL